LVEVEYKICDGVYYIHKMDHRDGTHDKSQWIIDLESERNCFRLTYDSHWCIPPHLGWGLHFDKGQVAYLGRTNARVQERRDIFIAKFVDGDRNSKWHGYPADHVKNRQDIPPESVLRNWADSQFIRRALVRKIASGQRCKL